MLPLALLPSRTLHLSYFPSFSPSYPPSPTYNKPKTQQPIKQNKKTKTNNKKSDNQEELDYYWTHLTESSPPESQQCGWVTDKFGVSWQVVPKLLKRLLASPEREKADRAMVAMMNMRKLDFEGLQKAFDG